MKKYSRRRMNKAFILLILVLVISIGYAVLTTALKINSTIGVGKVTFDIHFDNVQPLDNKATINEEAHIIDEAKKEISFDIFLARLDDDYKFTTDIVNEGSIPGKVKSIQIEGLTESQRRIIDYKVYYTSSNREIAVGDYFGPNSSKNVTVVVKYQLSDDVEDEDLPQDNLNLNCNFFINFENGSLDEYRARAAASKLSQDTNYMSSGSLHFDKSANDTEYQGLYVLDSTINDDFPVYFYRGGQSTPNHLVFANYCWRIIRTTNTGGIKIIYNGVPNESGECTATGTSTEVRRVKYGTNNTYGTSDLRTALEGWYFQNIIRYQNYIEDTDFCNTHNYTNGNVSLECPSDAIYSLSKNNISYPVGLISAHESDLCGVSTQGSTYPWLYTGSMYWTISRYSSSYGSATGIWIDNTHGSFDGYGVNDPFGMRPVISLNSEVELYDGDGSQSNPYKVRLS